MLPVTLNQKAPTNKSENLPLNVEGSFEESLSLLKMFEAKIERGEIGKRLDRTRIRRRKGWIGELDGAAETGLHQPGDQ